MYAVENCLKNDCLFLSLNSFHNMPREFLITKFFSPTVLVAAVFSFIFHFINIYPITNISSPETQ